MLEPPWCDHPFSPHHFRERVSEGQRGAGKVKHAENGEWDGGRG